MLNDFGYVEKAFANTKWVVNEQGENIKKATSMTVDAIERDKLINVYGGGGHTTLVMGEMFFHAGGLSNIKPIMETGISVFNQALKYLELELCENFGRSVMKYYDLQKADLLIIFHNIGINATTIDAALEAKERGVKIIAVSSPFWQDEMPEEHFICHLAAQTSTLYFPRSCPISTPNLSSGDMLLINGKMKDGTIFLLDPSWSRMEERLKVLGLGWEFLPKRMELNLTISPEKGVIVCDCFGPNVYYNGAPNDRYTVQYTYFDEWIGLIDEFVDCIRNNKQPQINLKWHHKTIPAMNACFESICNSAPTKVS
jgi:hypothetical protein